MTDTSPEAVERLADNLMAAPTHHYIGYGQSSAFTLRALSAQLIAAFDALEQARADGYAQGVRDAAGAKVLDVSRLYCTNDESFYNKGAAAKNSAIRALIPAEPTSARLEQRKAAQNEQIITDEQIIRVHAYANFGSMTAREVVNDGVRKYAVGYTGGSTQVAILREHGLIKRPKNAGYKADVTEKGKRYARSIYHDCLTQADVDKAVLAERERIIEDIN